MKLSTEEEKMLNGEFGEAKQIAIKLLIDLGEFFGAEKLISINSTHISGVSYLTGGDGLIEQLEYFVSKNAKVSVFSTLNPCGMDKENWKEHYIDLNFATKQFQILQCFRDLDVTTTCSCTPYDFGAILGKGEHIAWAESSAVCFANSYFGAKTNKEDSLSVLASAITGRTPYYGFHLDENRKPNVKVEVNAEITEYSDYSILGEIVGNALKKHSFKYGAIPVFYGLSNLRPQHFKALGAALASFGTQLYHIKDITPEQHLLENSTIVDEITVDNQMVLDTYQRLSPPTDVKLAVIGCPNANIEEIAAVTKLVQGRKLKKNKEFWVFTNAAQKAVAQSTGYLDKLDEVGVKVLIDTCPEVTPYDKTKFDKILTNSIKAQHYISAPALNGIPTYLLPLAKCIDYIFEQKEEGVLVR